ncbi:Male-enhanced antigen 1 [Tupaia chinensis]|uniref:Male-enhanced antigen 1 n=1 Tax=Tupaia chinensis TaxID=246437 RepID=L9LFL9_TUPCH|nr:Male-enhanced antigen 1 [Tupaia chinensis]
MEMDITSSRSEAPAQMAAVVLGGDTVGPEGIFPSQTEELDCIRVLQKALGIGAVELAPVGDGEDVVGDIQYQMQALGLHLPDPPSESEDEDEEGVTALSNHSSVPMDPEHAELVKRTMTRVSLPAPGVPAWVQRYQMPNGKMWYRKPSKPGKCPLPGGDHTES